MAATSSKKTGKKRNFVWTQETRLAVHTLDTEYDFSVTQKTRLFSLLFPEQYIHDGGMQRRISAQSSQWQRLSPGCGPAWMAVLRPAVPLDMEREDMMIHIRKAAAEAGFSADVFRRSKAVGKDRSSSPDPRDVSPLSRKRGIAHWTPESIDSDTADELEFDTPCPSSKRRRSARMTEQDHPQVQIHRVFARADFTYIAEIQIGTSAKRRQARASGNSASTTEEYSEGVEEDPEYSEAAFVARKYRGKLNIYQEPPHCTRLEWQDLFYHFNPNGKDLDRGNAGGKDRGVDSPFISTSNALWETVQRALRQSRKSGCAHARISIIDTTALDRRSVFHALPFYCELKKLRQFTSGGWKFPALHEFLCHKEIPRKAIIKTIKLRHFIAAVERGPGISRVLRLNVLAMRGDFKSMILPKILRKAEIRLTPQIVDAIATLAHLLGLDAFAKPEHHAHMMTDLIQGWGLKLAEATQDQWVELASRYARSIASYDHSIVSSRVLEKLELGFLDGVRHGCSRQWNPRFPSNGKHDVEERARKVGLSDPHEMLSAPRSSLSARKTIRSWKYKTMVETPNAQLTSTEESLSEEIHVVHPPTQSTSPVATLRKRFRETVKEEQVSYDSD